MLYPFAAIAMMHQKRMPHPEARSPRYAAQQHQPGEQCQPARRHQLPDQTSRPEPPEIDQMPNRKGCSEKPPGQPSRSPHEREPGIPPKDATDKEARAPPSCGRSVAVLYNINRPHSALGYATPEEQTPNVGKISNQDSHAE
jgi:hypothetical protein